MSPLSISGRSLRCVTTVGALLLVVTTACSSTGGVNPTVSVSGGPGVPGPGGSLPVVSDTAPGALPTLDAGSTTDTFPVAPGSTTTTATATTVPTTTTTTTAPTTTTTLPPEIIPADVLFDTGSWTLRRDAGVALEALAADIATRAPAATLMIVGHTDSRGSERSNLLLSERRAFSVRTWFEHWGFSASVLSSGGRGEAELLVLDTDDDGRFVPEAGQLNRRVEVHVTP